MKAEQIITLLLVLLLATLILAVLVYEFVGVQAHVDSYWNVVCYRTLFELECIPMDALHVDY